jgi:hypothetical protein
MDTSETYIKMCEEATEIQEHEPEAGDYYKSGNDSIVILPMSDHIVDFCSYDCLYLIGEDDAIWLPRQDQLQEIVGSYQECLSLIDRYDCVSALDFDYPNANSMEQLWLMITMNQYNKIWNEIKWEVDG